MKTIELDERDGDFFGIIVPGATGVLYTNQVGGTSCAHPKLEGTYYPLWLDSMNDVFSIPQGVLWSPSLNDPLLDYFGAYRTETVDKFLKQHPLLDLLFKYMLPANAGQLDFGMGASPTTQEHNVLAEAWVPVVTANHHMVVIVYKNSD